MFQVTFSEQSLSILEKLTRSEQLKVIENMSLHGQDIISGNSANIGKFNRSGKEIYRLRYEDLRFYLNIQVLLYIVSTYCQKIPVKIF